MNHISPIHWLESSLSLHLLAFECPLIGLWLPLIFPHGLGETSTPFPGFYTLKLETVGRVNYIAFNSHDACEAFAGSIFEQKSEILSSV